jgi:hypothetical protein
MTRTLTVEGDLTAVDTATTLSTQGSNTSPSLLVPSGVSKIDRILVAVAADLAAAGSASYFIRLGGVAIKNGEQTIVVGAEGGTAVQSGSDQAPSVNQALELEDVDIAVSAQDSIRVQGEMAGTDLGTARMVVTLVFA